MADKQSTKIAIVDYGIGNLYSVKHACSYAGIHAVITSSRDEIFSADAVILPGVGAFGDAMSTLHRLDLVTVLQDVAASNQPLIGICLGMQLLMTESYEFGHQQGLGIIEGPVVPFDHPSDSERRLKVPQIGWNKIWQPNTEKNPWANSLLNGMANGAYMYFIHSYIAQPLNTEVILSTSTYGQIEFCSSLRKKNVFACQFHPERSGTQGLHIYRNLATVFNS